MNRIRKSFQLDGNPKRSLRSPLQLSSGQPLRFFRCIPRQYAKMLYSPCLVILFLSIVTARPVLQTRDVKAYGPAGVLSPKERWADALGSAFVWIGPALKHSVLHTSPMGPLSTVYRDVLRNFREPCEADDGSKCEIAIGGFGTVGEVQYDFSNPIENVRGRSTQVLVACRCVGEECNSAVLIRPINVFENLPPKANEKPVQRTCLYEAVGNGFTDCHSEMHRYSRRPIGQRPEYTHGGDGFVYTVDGRSSQSKWTAQGQRGYTIDCRLSDVNSLPTATMDDFKRIQQNVHTTPANNGCQPPNNLIQYFREADQAAGEACYATYEYAAAAASQFGSQQDGFAIGLRQDSYMDSKPQLVSNTELALTCSAAGLGVLVLWGLYQTKRENADLAGNYLFRLIMVQLVSYGFESLPLVQLVSYGLESLPLHIALAQETFSRGWESEFADVGGSVALGSDQLGAQGSAKGSVVVMTAVLGTVKLNSTRVSLVAAFTVAFDIVALGIIIATMVTRGRPQPKAGMPQPRRPVRRFRFMRRYPPRETQKNERKQLELEARLRQQQIQNVGRHTVVGSIGWNGDASVGMRRESTESSGLSDVPVSVDIGSDVGPTIGPGAHGTDVAFASPPEQTAAGGDGSHTSPQEGMKEV